MRNADFSYEMADIRFRGNAYYRQGVLAIALRLIPKTIKTLAELNLPPILETFTRKSQGFFLVVGPIGQGKTTTLASMIELINQTRAEHILTIEDPIEYLFESKKSIIDQREVRIDTPDFPDALTAMFREDINVCLLGRDARPGDYFDCRYCRRDWPPHLFHPPYEQCRPDHRSHHRLFPGRPAGPDPHPAGRQFERHIFPAPHPAHIRRPAYRHTSSSSTIQPCRISSASVERHEIPTVIETGLAERYDRHEQLACRSGRKARSRWSAYHSLDPKVRKLSRK